MDIVHVEDDPDLAEVLKESLEHLGFAGTLVQVQRVDEARRVIDAAERLDIVFSDMNLVDGTGLDVIRHVRRHSRWRNTPIIVMSSDKNPATLGDAYALGVNSYVLKAPRGRSPFDVMKSIYDHWLTDVALPRPDQPCAAESLRQLAKLRERHSDIYLQLAQRFASEPDFWLARALNQSNRSNLLRFLGGQLEAQRAFPADLLAALDQSIRDHEQRLAAIERTLRQRPPATREEAGALMLELIDLGDHETQLRAVSSLFPVSRVAANALLDAWATNLELVAAWIEENTSSDALQPKAALLRDQAAVLRRHEVPVQQGDVAPP